MGGPKEWDRHIEELKTRKVPGRAYTKEQKETLLKTIMMVWEAFPSMRLGQLLVNATKKNDIFYVEDVDIGRACLDYLEAVYAAEAAAALVSSPGDDPPKQG